MTGLYVNSISVVAAYACVRNLSLLVTVCNELVSVQARGCTVGRIKELAQWGGEISADTTMPLYQPNTETM